MVRPATLSQRNTHVANHFSHASRSTIRETKAANPVGELISDELYALLRSNDIINEKGLRDYIIRRLFKQLRSEQDLKSTDAIDRIKELYPYIQADTIRKIVYRVYPTHQRKMMV